MFIVGEAFAFVFPLEKVTSELYMKRFAMTWTDPLILQQAVAKLQWRSVIMLMTKLNDNPIREWYAQKALEYGWSSNVLWHMIDMRLIEREGKAVTNFPVAIPEEVMTSLPTVAEIEREIEFAEFQLETPEPSDGGGKI